MRPHHPTGSWKTPHSFSRHPFQTERGRGPKRRGWKGGKPLSSFERLLGLSQSGQCTVRHPCGARGGKGARMPCAAAPRTRIFQLRPFLPGWGSARTAQGAQPPPAQGHTGRAGQRRKRRDASGVETAGEGTTAIFNDTARARPPPAGPDRAARPGGRLTPGQGGTPGPPPAAEGGPGPRPTPRPPAGLKSWRAPARRRRAGGTRSAGTAGGPGRAAADRGQRPAHARPGPRTTAPSAPRAGGARRGARRAL